MQAFLHPSPNHFLIHSSPPTSTHPPHHSALTHTLPPFSIDSIAPLVSAIFCLTYGLCNFTTFTLNITGELQVSMMVLVHASDRRYVCEGDVGCVRECLWVLVSAFVVCGSCAYRSMYMCHPGLEGGRCPRRPLPVTSLNDRVFPISIFWCFLKPGVIMWSGMHQPTPKPLLRCPQLPPHVHTLPLAAVPDRRRHVHRGDVHHTMGLRHPRYHGAAPLCSLSLTHLHVSCGQHTLFCVAMIPK